jgi:hypothetical protein
MAAMRELPDISADAKYRLRRPNAAIMQQDLEELLRKLSETQAKINNEMERAIADSKIIGDTEWDQAGYAVFVAPTFQMANSPKAIVDLTLAAANNGAKSAKLVYELMIAEMDVAVARFYVTMNTGIRTP